MTVSSVTDPTNSQAAANAASTAAAASSASVSALSVNDFLTLLTTHLKNQDPDQPVDPARFVTQLAQFGTVSGIQSMQTSLSSLRLDAAVESGHGGRQSGRPLGAGAGHCGPIQRRSIDERCGASPPRRQQRRGTDQ